jgi:hypothetical protein
MADVSGKFFSAVKVRTGVSPSSPGTLEGETLQPVNPPGGGLNSVGITMPSAFAVANSPLTSNGTIQITGAGTIAQYVRGDGTLETFPSLTGFVPYTGATQNVDLGEFGVDAGFVTLDTTPTNTPTSQGTIFWDVDDETVDVVLNGYIMKIGEDQFYPVKNQTGSSIAKGTAVRFAGTVGASGRLLIAPFIADGSVSSSFFMGVTAEAIADGADGKVLYFGRIRGINTNAFNEGDVLYASTTVAGGFQTAVPLAPNNIVQVAAVINKSINQGVIFIRPSFGSNINQDEGVKIVSPTTGQLLQLQANGLWENKTKAQVLGGTSSQFVKGDGTLDSNTYQLTSEKAQPNGYASLDSNGKVPLVQINDALIGNVNFQGLWNAATNTPTLANPPASGTKGYYYIVSTAGTFASISFEVGDWIISDGTAWGKVDNTDAVSSVFGRTGNVTAANGDYTTAQVTESGNLYYTDGRARGALSFVAGSGAYNSTTGVITIPTNNNQITNGAGYITSAALSGYLPLTGGTMTGNVNWAQTDRGITWGFNTDGASIKFYNTADGDTNSRLEFATLDNNNEYFRWVHIPDGGSVYESMRLMPISSGNAELIVTGKIIKSGGTSTQFLKADGSVDSNTYVTGGPFLPITGGTLTGALNGTTASFTGNLTATSLTASESFDGLINALSTRNASSGTNARNRFRFGNDSSANIFTLDVFGSNHTGQSNNVNLSIQTDTGNLIFGTAGTERMRITSAGNVGIGTQTPDQKLDVLFNTSAGNRRFLVTQDGVKLIRSGDSGGWAFGYGFLRNDGVDFGTGFGGAGNGSGLVYYFIGNTFDNPNAVFLPNGNTLIGKTSDNGAKFQVNGSANFSTLAGSGNRIVVANSGGTLISAVIGSGLAFDGTTLTATGGSSGSISGSGTSGTIALFTGSTSIGNSVITQSSGVSVFGHSAAVGTAFSPPVQVKGGAGIGNGFGIISGNNEMCGGLQLSSSGSNSLQITVDPDNLRASSEFAIAIDGTQRIIIKSSGNLLIGTETDNGARLQTVGGPVSFTSVNDGTAIFARRTGGANVFALNVNLDSSWTMFDHAAGTYTAGITQRNGNVTVGGSVTATSFFESSDARIKTLVEDAYQAKGIDSVVAKLYIKNGKQELGYYAQDLEGVLPSAVSKGSNGLLNLSYREVHTAKIAYLEQQIKELRNELLKPS